VAKLSNASGGVLHLCCFVKGAEHFHLEGRVIIHTLPSCFNGDAVVEVISCGKEILGGFYGNGQISCRNIIWEIFNRDQIF